MARRAERTFLMSTSKPDLHRGSRPAPSRRKPGRPFKDNPGKPNPDALAVTKSSIGKPAAMAATALPPAIPYRSFKIALSVFKDQQIPKQLDRSAWSNKLYNTNVREIIEAFRFLGLIDSASSPTPAFASLVAALNGRGWPKALREVLERSYHPLLAGSATTLKTGGLLRAFRVTYGTQAEDTRKRCNFFMHAAREAALETGSHLLANGGARLVDGRRDRKAIDPVQPHSARPAGAGSPEEIVSDLLLRLPAYDAGWPDEIKRLWFGAYHDLVQRLSS